jgi:hypothetical protein
LLPRKRWHLYLSDTGFFLSVERYRAFGVLESGVKTFNLLPLSLSKSKEDYGIAPRGKFFDIKVSFSVFLIFQSDLRKRNEHWGSKSNHLPRCSP